MTAPAGAHALSGWELLSRSFSARSTIPAHTPHTGFPEATNWRTGSRRPASILSGKEEICRPTSDARFANRSVCRWLSSVTSYAHDSSHRARMAGFESWREVQANADCRGLSSWNDERSDALKLRRCAYFNRRHVREATQRRDVLGKRALESKNSDRVLRRRRHGFAESAPTGDIRRDESIPRFIYILIEMEDFS